MPQTPRQPKICPQCGQSFLYKKSKTQMFCSRPCRHDYYTRGKSNAVEFAGCKTKTGDTIPCHICGTEFYRALNEIKRDRRYCSVKCSRESIKTRFPKVCGHCGETFMVYPVHGEQKYCSRLCASDAKIINPSGRTHNGRPIRNDAAGYVLLWEPEHPVACNQGNWYPEHRIVMELELGRYLEPFEHVHHINHVKDDNRPENLQVVTSKEHSAIHMRSLHKRVRDLNAELDRYRALYGPLPQEEAM